MLTTQELLSSESVSAELPLLASQAAIEFDCALKGRNIGFTAASTLGQFIQHDALNDFVAENLVCQALARSDWNPGVSTFSEASASSIELAGALKEATPEKANHWEKLRDFCVKFSAQLVSHRQALRATLPTNPNRR